MRSGDLFDFMSYCELIIFKDGKPAGARMCDCLHVDDLAAILADKGLDKRPKGK